MIQGDMLSKQDDQGQTFSLGNGFVLEFSDREKNLCKLFHYDKLIKNVDLSDKVAKKLLVIDAVALGVVQSYLADALEISRQTIHNYREIHKYFGIEGLVHSYNPVASKSLEEQRRLHTSERVQGNKAEQVAAIRAEQKEAEEAEQESLDASLNF